MDYNQVLEKIKQGLDWLDADARRAIELQETFTFPAYDKSIREIIKGTNKVRCYNLCLRSLYFEFIMTLMRMYDSYERDTVCFKNLFDYLSDEFILVFEKSTQRVVNAEIADAQKEYTCITGSHLLGKLKTVRHNMFAHTSIKFNRRQVAKYGHAEKLLERTLPMLNRLNTAINGKMKSYDLIHEYWKGYAIEFWQSIIKKA